MKRQQKTRDLAIVRPVVLETPKSHAVLIRESFDDLERNAKHQMS